MIKRPLDPTATRAADQALAAKTGGRPLTMSPEDAALRADWVQAYNASLPPPKAPTPLGNAPREMGSSIQQCPLPPPPPETEFQKNFKKWTNGLTVQESIDLYHVQTGKTLTEEEVKTLFDDPTKAKEMLEADKDLHSVYRDILNSHAPATEKDAIAAGYTQPTFLGSEFLGRWYHDPWVNSKYVDPTGHLESVFDGDGNLVSSNDYKGTFNFFPPDQAGDHKLADVDPYRKWGN